MLMGVVIKIKMFGHGYASFVVDVESMASKPGPERICVRSWENHPHWQTSRLFGKEYTSRAQKKVNTRITCIRSAYDVYHRRGGKKLSDTLAQQYTNSTVHTLAQQYTNSTVHTLAQQYTNSTVHTLAQQYTNSTVHTLARQYTNNTVHTLARQYTYGIVHTLVREFTNSTVHTLAQQYTNSYRPYIGSTVYQQYRPYTCSTVYLRYRPYTDSTVYQQYLPTLALQYTNSTVHTLAQQYTKVPSTHWLNSIPTVSSIHWLNSIPTVPFHSCQKQESFEGMKFQSPGKSMRELNRDYQKSCRDSQRRAVGWKLFNEAFLAQKLSIFRAPSYPEKINAMSTSVPN
ncbi:A-agglutinin anchorage subunit-like [Elysia marginata]|uniref:A-agglutinin anchorage subunit-like n=1 Tax=Elysia marginata TaxID=1093978 RepID=A0AAV4FUH6_9GAST|nr:A-agglutinin anchorage subunit-like [Elysia marginata]